MQRPLRWLWLAVLIVVLDLATKYAASAGSAARIPDGSRSAVNAVLTPRPSAPPPSRAAPPRPATRSSRRRPGSCSWPASDRPPSAPATSTSLPSVSRSIVSSPSLTAVRTSVFTHHTIPLKTRPAPRATAGRTITNAAAPLNVSHRRLIAGRPATR